ncbi:MAG: flagellar export chaperone FliS [Aquabacterium sp.]|nr:flagellar export chaperone FliS [Aquabacterium sp.]
MLNRAHARYRQNDNVGAVNGRSPMELILLIYDRIDDKLADAEVAIAASERLRVGNAINQAVELINQGLLAALNHELGGEVSRNLALLYDYCVRRLLQASLLQDAGILREVRGLLSGLREAWASLQVAPHA